MADDRLLPLAAKRKRHRRTGLYPNAICRICDKHRCSGRNRTCDECKRDMRLANERRKYRANPEKFRAKARGEYRRAISRGPEIAENKRKQARESYRRHAETRKVVAASYRKRKRAEDAIAFRSYQRACSIKSRARDPEDTKRRFREYSRKRREGNLKARINARMAERLRLALKRLGLSKDRCGWQRLVGYTIREATERLLDTMPAGYSLDDFLCGRLHIDHILPIASFHFTSVDDPAFKSCWALNNLQLLPGAENIRKSARLDWQASA